MSNRSASKQHGLNDIKRLQPKSKLRKRRNKALANQRKVELRAITYLGLKQSSKTVPVKAGKKVLKKQEKSAPKALETA